MSSPPPTKPPRGVKQGKETSGLLMSVIRTLSASETNEQREKERLKLEKEYKKSDARLDELVAEHAADIMEVMQKFNTATTALNSWGQHCDSAVARLQTCRNLLQLRRDDLSRLWIDARTHHYALQMLSDIERVVTSEREISSLMSTGRVLNAATVLATALNTAASLQHIDALSHIRLNLENKKQSLVEEVVRNLRSACWHSVREPPRTMRRRLADILPELTKNEEITESYLEDITPEYEASLSDEERSFDTTVVISLEALGVLDQLREGTEKFKVQIQTSLLEVIETTSKRILEEGDVDIETPGECEQDGNIATEGVTETEKPLARLVTRLNEEFKAGAERNRRLLRVWRAALHKYKISDSCLHTEQHYWSAVQQVMQLLLTEYLQIESVTLSAQRSNLAAADAAPRLPDYFLKKRPTIKPQKLFSIQASLMTTEGRPAPAGTFVRGAAALCQPSPALLHAALPALNATADHIESVTGVSECSLRAFITDYVRCGEATRLANIAREQIDNCMKLPSAWRERVPGDATHPQIYSCCVSAWRAVAACAVRARACGACGGAWAARGVLAAVAALAVHCKNAAPHRRMDVKAQRWLSDDDIVRFLQSLPNWRAVTSDQVNPDDKEFMKELSSAYSREAETLGSSLCDGVVKQHEIVRDAAALHQVALHAETMDWLSEKMKTLPSILSAPTAAGQVKLSDKFVNDVSAAAAIFAEVSHQCLLFLHLELRIQCFHYLGGGYCGESSAEEPSGASRLTHAILSFHEQASAIMAPRRRAYIISGLGEMMSWAVTLRWEGAAAAAAAGELHALRHCVAALHLPPAALARAQQYLCLLQANPQEIISLIKEKGPQFSEMEYLNALKVIGAKRGISPSDMKNYYKQLSSALGHIGVTV